MLQSPARPATDTDTARLAHAADALFRAGEPVRQRIIHSRDPDEASACLHAVYSRHRLHLRGRREAFDMRLQIAAVGQLEMARLGFGAEVELDQQASQRFTLVTTQLRGASEIHAGGAVHCGGPGMVVLDSAGTPVVKRFSRDSCRLNLRIDQALLASRWQALLGREAKAPLVFQPALAAGSPAQARWLALLRMMLACTGEHGLPASPLLLRQLEDTAALFLLTEVPHSGTALLRPEAAIAPRHVRRAEDYIRAHAGEPLTLADIAAAAGVSVRALSEGFRKARQTTPMAWLREQRLVAARDALRQASPQDTVAAIACDWGFGNLGRFAADYRRRFGESPSDTLRRG